MEGKLADARKAHRAYVGAANSPAGQARDEGRPPERPSARSGAAPAAGHVPRRPLGEIGDVARCLRHHVNVSFGSGPGIPDPRCAATSRRPLSHETEIWEVDVTESTISRRGQPGSRVGQQAPIRDRRLRTEGSRYSSVTGQSYRWARGKRGEPWHISIWGLRSSRKSLRPEL